MAPSEPRSVTQRLWKATFTDCGTDKTPFFRTPAPAGTRRAATSTPIPPSALDSRFPKSRAGSFPHGSPDRPPRPHEPPAWLSLKDFAAFAQSSMRSDALYEEPSRVDAFERIVPAIHGVPTLLLSIFHLFLATPPRSPPDRRPAAVPPKHRSPSPQKVVFAGF
jgi:hypothetical protein